MTESLFNPQFNFDGPTPPCGTHCPERTPGCAVTCERWAAYVRERNENYEKRKKRMTISRGTVAGQRAMERKPLSKVQRQKRGK